MNEKKTNLKRNILIVLSILCIILIIAGILVIRKISICNSLLSVSEKTKELKNYSVHTSTSESEVSNGFVKEEKYYWKSEKKASDGENIIEMKYRNGNTEFWAVDGYNQKMILKEHPLNVKPKLITFEDYLKSSEVVKSVFKIKINPIENENKKCYEIVFKNGITILVEKETGLVIKTKENGMISNISYDFNNVTEEDIQEPDLTGYVEV